MFVIIDKFLHLYNLLRIIFYFLVIKYNGSFNPCTYNITLDKKNDKRSYYKLAKRIDEYCDISCGSLIPSFENTACGVELTSPT